MVQYNKRYKRHMKYNEKIIYMDFQSREEQCIWKENSWYLSKTDESHHVTDFINLINAKKEN